MASSATARRLRRGLAEDEDAGLGKLGPDFNDAGCLLISEVNLFFSQPAGDGAEPASKDDGATAVAEKTKAYVAEFSRYKDRPTIREIRAILMKHAAKSDEEREYDEEGNLIEDDGLALTQFEMAQLANLCITEVEEAKSLIPTLAGKDDGLLDSLLQELDNVRRFS
ncbi:uncharacterized protein PFL1_04451 [Pseudozyma flocculosa PF-1]|uniref:Related to Rpb4 - 16 kD subunit of DNA-directed RNA polymerase II n=2 Tax=Pseudozyma flocculosa TaxID=84751 RepID=A0A5C3FE14_9BASI|nr:uncharacterized protein PFL1_04451 [Pseudozyma flocculosa PF-1]EPQ28124.1 hypothetical protein PFL1_04451 [Pseudozyma flocculosa PF-1]SPO41925.1 related to Rpb4 - 16 kD subunit of DNA-directed RNA polymerase II [Pseudozyma flocculosa]